MNYAALLVRDPATGGGETVFRGTRVLLRAVLADLADGARTCARRCSGAPSPAARELTQGAEPILSLS